MTAVGAELESQLSSMLEMKPPGANQAKISSITQFCNANISNESVLVQKIYTHFKKAPANYKLGALYVVDSIARSWLDSAKKAGQTLGASADGSFAGGVQHIQELLPVLINDVATQAPQEHKAKTKKLIDIWRRGATFPTQMISKFDEQLSEAAKSTTPTGTPPAAAVALATNAFSASAGAPAPASQNVSDILKGLAGFASTNSAATTPAPVPTPAPLNIMPQASYPQNIPVNGTPVQFPPVAGQQANMNVANQNNPLAALLAGAGIPQPPQQQQQQQQPPQQSAFALPQQQAPVMPPQPAGVPGMDPNMMKQLQILAQLKAMNVPQEQWAALLPIMMQQNIPQAGAGMPPQNPQAAFAGMYGGGMQSNDQSGNFESMRSPGRDRRRSRSPDYSRRRDDSPPRRRDSPTYGRYGEDRDSRRGGRDRGGRGRNRSQERGYRRSPSPRAGNTVTGNGDNDTDWGFIPRNITYDNNLPKDSIRVFSRTLFVGGVTCSDAELRNIFSAHGRVQTCIVNIDKRHAFVKMLTRDEAVRAKEAMEHYRGENMQLRTRWGVGFGPRDCSDYGTGVSVIPIGRLTDADRKWMLTAPYGGSGGEEIKTGLTVEEPDIEIGAGVSSKAISRRMQTDRSGQHGPRSSRDNQQQGGGGRRRGGDDDNPNNISVAPQVPGYGFNFGNMGNGNANNIPLGMNQNFGQGS